ncbi:MAG: EamA family transporter [Actinobacteria bacterium]|nr:EamA family transporter [Actinomycetota bacterium]
MLSRLRGELYLLSGALLFSFNGIVSKIVLVDGLSPWRLTQIRTGGAFVILFAIYFTFRRSELKTNKKELPWLIAFGVVGVALVQAFYFVAIERLYVGVALLIEFTAPLLFFVLPAWQFPVEIFTKDMELLGRFSQYSLPGWVLILWIAVMGTIAPYLLVVSGLKILSASTASIFGMIEPVLAGMFAWWWLSESLSGIQLIGCVVVLLGIFVADKARSKAGH